MKKYVQYCIPLQNNFSTVGDLNPIPFDEHHSYSILLYLQYPDFSLLFREPFVVQFPFPAPLAIKHTMDDMVAKYYPTTHSSKEDNEANLL